MKRRSFLKGLVKTVAVAAIAPTVIACKVNRPEKYIIGTDTACRGMRPKLIMFEEAGGKKYWFDWEHYQAMNKWQEQKERELLEHMFHGRV